MLPPVSKKEDRELLIQSTLVQQRDQHQPPQVQREAFHKLWSSRDPELLLRHPRLAPREVHRIHHVPFR